MAPKQPVPTAAVKSIIKTKPLLTDDYVHLITEELRKELDSVKGRRDLALDNNKKLSAKNQTLSNEIVKLKNNLRILNNQMIVLKKDHEKLRLKEKKSRLENQKLKKIIDRSKQINYISSGT